MLPSQLGTYNHDRFLREPCLVNVMDGGDSILSSSSSKSEKKSTDACKSHKEAERRRRQRINSHLSTLRTLLPSATKSDKASLLAEVVRHVTELRKKATAQVMGPENQYWPFPGESDEATLSYCEGGGGGEADNKTMRLSVCCDDRPGLNRDLSQAIRSVQAREVRAEMMTIGGRTKSVVVVQLGGNDRAAGGGEENVGVLRRALRGVVENRSGSGSSSGLGQFVPGNKRLRGFGPNDEFGIKNDDRMV